MMKKDTPSGSRALDALRDTLPALADLDERRALEVVSLGLRSDARAARQLAGFAGRRARELGCASEGPVQVAPSTWAHRSADGRTQVWHRPPTAAEVRALTSGRSATAAPTARTQVRTQVRSAATPTVKLSPAAARVGRIFK